MRYLREGWRWGLWWEMLRYLMEGTALGVGASAGNTEVPQGEDSTTGRGGGVGGKC